MNVWNEVKLCDVLQEKGYIRGPFGSALKRGDMKLQGIPVYEQQHAIYDHRDFRYYIDDRKVKEMNRFQVKTNDLIISCSGTVGKVSIIKENDPKGIISQALLLLRVDESIILPEYLKYYFISQEGYNAIVSRSSGSVQVNLAKRNVIEQITFKLPSISIQDSIVKVLSMIDSKIENNKAINNNLYELINSHYKLFLDNNASSEFVLFENKDEFGSLVMGQSPKGESYNHNQDGMPLLNGAADYTDLRLTPKKYTTNPKRICKEGDLVFCIRATIGLLVYADSTYCLGRGVAAIANIHKLYREFIYHTINNSIEIFKNNANGSVISGISKDDILKLKIPYIKEDKMKEFHEFQYPIFELIHKNSKENERLVSIRDALLPKLMSGELDVSDIDI